MTAAKTHYQVKFTAGAKCPVGGSWRKLDGKTACFGVVRGSPLDSDVQEAAKRGEVLVDDAVTTTVYLVKESDLTDIDFACGHYDRAKDELVGGDEFQQHVYAEHKKALEASARIESGVGVGSMFRIGVGDGYAHYVVTKVNKKTCKVEWRGFCLDRWTDHHFGWGGTFPLDEVARHVERGRALERLFAKKAT